MAKQATIGALRVTLGMDSAAFEKGVKDANSGLAKFGKAAAIGFAAVVSAATAAGTAIAMGMKKTIDEADNLVKTSDKIGMAVEDLQRLRYAAERAGVGAQTMDLAMQRFSRRVAEAAQGTGELKDTLTNYGIAIRDGEGRMRSQVDILRDLADAIQGAGSQQEALRIAFKAFDSEGAALVNMLREGSAALSEMMARADALGIVISESTARSAEQFNDNLGDMGTAFDAIILKLTADMLPTFEDFSEMLVQSSNDVEALTNVSDGLIYALKAIASAAVQVGAQIKMASLQIQGFARAASLVADGEFSAALDSIKAGIAEAKGVGGEVQGLIDQIWAAGTDDNMAARFGRDAEEVGAEAGRRAGSGFVTNFKEEAEKASAAGKAAKKVTDDMAAEAARIFDQTRTPLENYQTQIASLNELLGKGYINQDTYNRAVVEAGDAFDKASEAAKKGLTDMDKAGQDLGKSFGSSLTGLIKGTSSLRDVLADVVSSIGKVIGGFITKAAGGGAGGFFSGILGSFLSSFDGGGFTGAGARVGGLDGKGGFPAILHPNETVVDHRKMLSGSSGTSIVINAPINAAGADPAALARVERAVVHLGKSVPSMVDARQAERQTRGTRA